jgi:hemoglobin-like flavoprotein
MALNPELLQQSFALTKAEPDRFAATFYTTLFARYPEVEPLFANTLMAEQGQKLFKSLVLVVDNLQQPDVLATALRSLGSRHIKYGVLPQHYPMIGAALLESFALHLQSDWTPEVKQEWQDAYAAVTQLMLEGADYSPDILTLAN